MKYKNKFFIAVAVIVALSSCSGGEDALVHPSSAVTRFNATIEESDITTKTTISENSGVCHILWKKGDTISVNGEKYTADNNGAETIFSAVSDPATGTEFKAYFPSSLVGDGGVTTLPSVQTYGGENVISNIPTYAVSTTNILGFKSLCGVLAVRVEQSDALKVKSVKVSSDQPMCGEFEIAENDGIPYAKLKSSATCTYVILASEQEITISDNGNIFYLAVPVGTYTNVRIGLSSDGENYSQTMATTYDKNIQVARNMVYAFNYNVNSIILNSEITVVNQL